jgi:hypothetical protein
LELAYEHSLVRFQPTAGGELIWNFIAPDEKVWNKAGPPCGYSHQRELSQRFPSRLWLTGRIEATDSIGSRAVIFTFFLQGHGA